MEAREIVLPSGRFAAFRQMTWGDLIAAHSENTHKMMATIAARVCQIDGSPITVEQVAEMTLGEFMPIVNIIGDMMPKDMASKGVA